MRDAFVKKLLEIAKLDRDVLVATGDLGFGVLKPFFDELPEQIINMGIAEQNMTSVSAGLALNGKKVFTYSIGNFPTLRPLEQIRNDCAYHNANVKIVCIGGGFTYGGLGMSHFATEDISILRALPSVKVFAPADVTEAEKATQAVYKTDGTCYLRLGRGGSGRIFDENENFDIFKIHKLSDGKKVCVLSTGEILGEVKKAIEELKEENILPAVYSVPTVKPLDIKGIIKLADEFDTIITVEENTLVGGFGSAVGEALLDNGKKVKLIRIGVPDIYPDVVGCQKFLRNRYGLDYIGIKAKIKENY